MLSEISLPFGMHLRELQAQDHLFVEELFFSTREYFYQMPMPKSQIDLLLKQQFILQQTSYANTFPSSNTFVIQIFSGSIGKIILDNSFDALHVVDIAFIKSAQGNGYGSTILRALKCLAGQMGLPLRLSVDQQNTRAKKLYLSLGFALIESSNTHDTLIW